MSKVDSHSTLAQIYKTISNYQSTNYIYLFKPKQEANNPKQMDKEKTCPEQSSTYVPAYKASLLSLHRFENFC